MLVRAAPSFSVCLFKTGFSSGPLLAICTLIRWFVHSHEFHYYLQQSTLRCLSLSLVSSFKPQGCPSVCWIFPPGYPTSTFQLQMFKTKFVITSSLKNLPLCFCWWCHHSPSRIVITYFFLFLILSPHLSLHAHLCIFNLLNDRHQGLVANVFPAPCIMPGTQVGA